ncbi:hypothetical protein C8N43_0258 [Litoreibacter ponti]|uniref:Uncharacterized protein n=1 Tax=Litoreibacter ponti TaxID=1510457 RepID=A0A2T6BHT8_9RHOB|nr:hypothetical protein [Litoreibacter ponti]PTX55619.1 hypothetical protein C8N43_0258 [Litoreibacter ponti]
MELAQYVLGFAMLAAIVMTALTQIIWQGYRVATAPIGWRFNAGLIIALTITAIAPPWEYRDLDRMILSAALVILPCLAALIGDPRWWKLLSLAHIIAACAWVYVCIQAAR